MQARRGDGAALTREERETLTLDGLCALPDQGCVGDGGTGCLRQGLRRRRVRPPEVCPFRVFVTKKQNDTRGWLSGPAVRSAADAAEPLELGEAVAESLVDAAESRPAESNPVPG